MHSSFGEYVLLLIPGLVVWLFFHVFVYVHINLVFILPNILFVSYYDGCSIYICAGGLLLFHFMISLHGEKVFTFINYVILSLFCLMNIYFIFTDESKYIFIYLNNFIILYALLRSCYYMILRNAFIDKYKIEPSYASVKILVSQALSFGMRYGLGHVFHVWGFIFKPFTDLLANSIIKVQNMNEALYIVDKEKDIAIIVHSCSIVTTIIMVYYYFNDNLRFIVLKMSYVDMLYRIMDWYR